MNDNHEFEEMRQQMQTLKKKLEQQEIVSDRLILRSMKRSMTSITRRYQVLMALGLLIIPYSYWAFVKLSGFSIAFWIGTCIFMVVCTAATYYNSHLLSDPGLMEHDLVETRERMARAKKFDSDWLFFGIPALMLWLGWFVYEVHRLSDNAFGDGLFWGGCIGGIIGGIFGYAIHAKTQRQYREIIEQIEDITRE